MVHKMKRIHVKSIFGNWIRQSYLNYTTPCDILHNNFLTTVFLSSFSHVATSCLFSRLPLVIVMPVGLQSVALGTTTSFYYYQIPLSSVSRNHFTAYSNLPVSCFCMQPPCLYYYLPQDPSLWKPVHSRYSNLLSCCTLMWWVNICSRCSNGIDFAPAKYSKAL